MPRVIETATAAPQRLGRDYSAELLGLFLLFSTPAFHLLTFNSGYGYEQLEYLVVGRALAYPLYYWLPSKSFALYALVAGLYAIGVSFGHVPLSVAITALYGVIVLLTYRVARRTVTGAVGLIAAVLVAVCAAFMELTFLQPTTRRPTTFGGFGRENEERAATRSRRHKENNFLFWCLSSCLCGLLSLESAARKIIELPQEALFHEVGDT